MGSLFYLDTRTAAMAQALQSTEMKPSHLDRVEPSASHTSIEQVFRRELLLMRFSGGLLFDWPSKLLALAYRFLVMAFMLYCRLNILKHIKAFSSMIPTHNRKMIDLYLSINFPVLASSLFTAIFLEIRHHDIMNIVLKKRLQRAYLTRTELTPVKRGTGQSQAKMNQAERLKLVQQTRPDETHMPSATFLRRAMVTNIIWLGLVLAVAEFSSPFVIRCTRNASGMQTLVGGEIGGGNASDHLALDFHCNIRALFNQLMRNDQPAWMFVVGQLSRLLVLLPFCLVTSLLVVCQFDGLVLVNLMMRACMTDMLVRTNEQEQLLQQGRVRNRLQSKDEPHLYLANIVPTTELLLQIRDVLVVLRRSFNLNYVLVYIVQTTVMMVNYGSSFSLAATGRIWMTALSASLTVAIFVRMLTYRAVQDMLCGEAARLVEANQRKLAYQSSRWRSETKTVVKLAEEIEQLAPTDWVKTDVKSLLSDSLRVFVFAVSLHQITEKSMAKIVNNEGRQAVKKILPI